MTAKCRCTDAHTLDCYWFTPDREAYDVLAAQVVEVTGERDAARRIAVELEQQVAEVSRLQRRWELSKPSAAEYDYGRWHYAAARSLGAILSRAGKP